MTTMFTANSARTFDKGQLADASTYPAATIEAAEIDIGAEFADILGFYPVPTVTTAEIYDGTGTEELMLVRPYVTTLVAIVVTDTDHVADTWTLDELADVAVYESGRLVCTTGGYFPLGHQNVAVTYISGLTTVPGDLQRAALMVCVRRLCATDVPWEVTSGNYEGFNWTATVDPSRNRWYGNDRVDGVLARYRRMLPGIA